MTVSFFGHRDADFSEKTKEALLLLVRRLTEEGADCFLLGGRGNFDALAASVIRQVKKECAGIRSVLVISYLGEDFDRSLYDESVYPPLEKVPKRFAIAKRNEWMVMQSDAVIGYVEHDWGGAAKALSFAEKKGKRTIRFYREGDRRREKTDR